MSGDRRLIRTTYTKDGLLVCAETQADAISARSASSALEAVGEGAISDDIIQQLTLTNARTELSDVVRQLAWHLCNARANNHISAPAYEASLSALQTQALQVLAQRQSPDSSAAVKELVVLKEKTEAGAVKVLEAANAREAGRAAQTKERTTQMELLAKEKKYQDCRQDNKDNPAERAKCSRDHAIDLLRLRPAEQRLEAGGVFEALFEGVRAFGGVGELCFALHPRPLLLKMRNWRRPLAPPPLIPFFTSGTSGHSVRE